MNQYDHLVRATAFDGRVRAFALDATGVVRTLQAKQGTFPTVTAALGRTAMGALLLGAATLKEEGQILTVEVRGDGPAGRMICTANGRGEVRGLAANPHAEADSVEPGKLNVAGVVGRSGYISVTRDLGMRERYQGMTELLTGEIGDDLAGYLARSEQVPSAVGLGVFVEPDTMVTAAGGFLVQLLPGVDDEATAAIEEGVRALPHPTRLIRDGVTPEGVLERLFPEGYRLLDRFPVRFHCPCSRERFEAALVSLGEEEVARIISEETETRTELVCHFCNSRYDFAPDQMREMLRRAS